MNPDAHASSVQQYLHYYVGIGTVYKYNTAYNVLYRYTTMLIPLLPSSTGTLTHTHHNQPRNLHLPTSATFISTPPASALASASRNIHTTLPLIHTFKIALVQADHTDLGHFRMHGSTVLGSADDTIPSSILYSAHIGDGGSQHPPVTVTLVALTTVVPLCLLEYLSPL
jgi:hypothetical protein